jgi:hypothetical protein
VVYCANNVENCCAKMLRTNIEGCHEERESHVEASSWPALQSGARRKHAERALVCQAVCCARLSSSVVHGGSEFGFAAVSAPDCDASCGWPCCANDIENCCAMRSQELKLRTIVTTVKAMLRRPHGQPTIPLDRALVAPGTVCHARLSARKCL